MNNAPIDPNNITQLKKITEENADLTFWSNQDLGTFITGRIQWLKLKSKWNPDKKNNNWTVSSRRRMRGCPPLAPAQGRGPLANPGYGYRAFWGGSLSGDFFSSLVWGKGVSTPWSGPGLVSLNKWPKKWKGLGHPSRHTANSLAPGCL